MAGVNIIIVDNVHLSLRRLLPLNTNEKNYSDAEDRNDAACILTWKGISDGEIDRFIITRSAYCRRLLFQFGPMDAMGLRPQSGL